ncbi:hypothetical protein [Mesorhizobium sp. B2-8-9]|uniref:hypothetical protein n=1 Tax=Mesorhizobium sp. B2-8-9 TaxID=2589899 RepID=UPI00112D3D35|nr:hypothetical protein [Mesorhizobium sp. B2-8-9]TPI86429.1 hypothetical protein FJ423_00980 [Mesorhizobium sp. B2-8-9]
MNNEMEELNGIAWRDVLMNTVIGFVCIIGVMALMITMKAKAEQEGAIPPGNLIVHAVWPSGDTDIDLWVNGPGEPVPVGYSNKGGLLWNLLRDDLGIQPDATDINYEDAATRGVIGGEYTINVHCYRCPTLPQKVDLEASINTGEPGKASLKVLATTHVTLVSAGQEATGMNFILREDGTIEPNSLNQVFRPLRSGKK